MSELKVYYATYATNYLVSGLYDKSIQVLDINEKVIVNKFDVSNGGHLNYVHLLEPIGNRFIATVAQTEEIKIWDIVNGELKYTFNKTNQGHTVYIEVLFPFGDDLLASGSRDSSIKIWNVREGKLLYTFDE